ncbi:hypothetical protein NQ318_005071 [Aromia moschata]|uniref:Uncharacterized protein n=1 Tax=Aromia moschata TaxID=1265417 RepID=A0AAV8YFD2_9CUCU|nr:hypothetical protein NQ318_005071 [Aromia moschata]
MLYRRWQTCIQLKETHNFQLDCRAPEEDDLFFDATQTRMAAIKKSHTYQFDSCEREDFQHCHHRREERQNWLFMMLKYDFIRGSTRILVHTQMTYNVSENFERMNCNSKNLKVNITYKYIVLSLELGSLPYIPDTQNLKNYVVVHLYPSVYFKG